MNYFADKGCKFDFVVDTSKARSVLEICNKYGGVCIEKESFRIFFFGYEGYLPTNGCVVSGYTSSRGRIILGPCAIDACPDAVGDWIALSYSNEIVNINVDPFSSSPVYYSNQLVSNSLHLLNIIHKHTGRYAPNLSALASNFLFENSFTMQPSTFHTPITGVYQLENGSSILVSNGAVETVRKNTYCDVVNHEEYWRLIDQGANEIVDNVSKAVSSGRTVIAALTGGRDSRLLYAAILAGGYVDDVKFTTRDIGRDLYISASLLGRFGGKYIENGDVGIFGQPFNPLLEKIQSHNQFSYHSIDSLVKQVSIHHTYPTYLLGGGFGEVYRGFYQDMVDKIISRNDGRSDSDLVSKWVRDFSEKSFANPEVAREDVESTFSKLGTADPATAFIRHYLNFRAKYHFGNKIHRSEKVDIHALQSQSLLELSQRVPSDILFSGRIVFDVTRRLCEELAYYEYDKSSDVKYHDLSYHMPSRYDGDELLFDALDYDKGISSRSRGSKLSPLPLVKEKGEIVNIYNYSFYDAPKVIDRCYTKEVFKVDREVLIKKLEWLKSKKSRNVVKYYSIFSQLDYYLN